MSLLRHGHADHGYRILDTFLITHFYKVCSSGFCNLMCSWSLNIKHVFHNVECIAASVE